MNLMDLFIKIGVDDQASRQVASISQKLGKGLKTAAKIGTAAVLSAKTGIVALATQATKAYADYEQLAGGVETLFKENADTIKKYADDAYKTAGMSANEYMENAVAFSASLISSLGGDTEKAAEHANRAMISMSDNANKMGTDISTIVGTYQSLSRGTFNMLDNLRLGYGGTKTELQRLISDASKYIDIQKEMGITVDASSMSFANIVNAIAVVQGKLGIAGATALEAETTITGSISSAKAAWQNWLTALSIGTEETEERFDSLVSSVKTVVKNLTPAISTAVSSINGLVSSFADEFINAGENEDTFVDVGYNYLHKILDGVNDSFKYGGKSKNKIAQFLSKLGDELTDPDNLGTLMLDAKQLATNIINGIADASSEEGVGKILDNITAILNDPTQLESSRELGKALGNLVASVFDFGDQETETIGDKIQKLFYASLKNQYQFYVDFGKAIGELIVEGITSITWEDVAKKLDSSGFLGVLISEIDGTRDSWFHEVFGYNGTQKEYEENAINNNVLVKFFRKWGNADIMSSYVEETTLEKEPSKYTNNNTASTKNDIQIIIEGAQYENEEELAEAIAQKIEEMTQNKRNAVPY